MVQEGKLPVGGKLPPRSKKRARPPVQLDPVITVKLGEAILKGTPYHEALVATARTLQGRWDAEALTWTFSRDHLSRVSSMVFAVFGVTAEVIDSRSPDVFKSAASVRPVEVSDESREVVRGAADAIDDALESI